jgi:hypothetical protein
MIDIESITILENLSCNFLNTSSIFATPSNISNNEKMKLIALIAITSSVVSGTIYEYQFQIFGIKKCQIPNPIEMVLPITVRIIRALLLDCIIII